MSYDRLADDAERQPRRRVVDHSARWEKLQPLGSVNGAIEERVRAFCTAKRIRPEALIALEARVKVDKHGGVLLAYAGRAGIVAARNDPSYMMWSCNDVDWNVYLWSIHWQAKRFSRRRWLRKWRRAKGRPTLEEMFRLMYPDVAIPRVAVLVVHNGVAKFGEIPRWHRGGTARSFPASPTRLTRVTMRGRRSHAVSKWAGQGSNLRPWD